MICISNFIINIFKYNKEKILKKILLNATNVSEPYKQLEELLVKANKVQKIN